jgi:triosephosphate isomerase
MKKIIIANWKMKLNYSDTLKLAKQFVALSSKTKNEIVVCPDFSALAEVGKVIKKSRLILGAQDVAAFNLGAYTGEVSALSLKQLDCRYVIIGHSERRQYNKEDDALINLKIKTALPLLIPILCIGEKLSDRKRWKQVLKKQIDLDLKGVEKGKLKSIIIAYEPIWAIGTGQTVSAQEAKEAYNFIVAYLLSLGYSQKQFQVIYGGSVDPKNAGQLSVFAGFLIGGTSLKPKDFFMIANNF